MVFTLYGYKEHDLEFLTDKARTHSLDVCGAFPRNTSEEERLFKLLQDAYVQARYNKNFAVTKDDIDALTVRVERLRDITEKSAATVSHFTTARAGNKNVPINDKSEPADFSAGSLSIKLSGSLRYSQSPAARAASDSWFIARSTTERCVAIFIRIHPRPSSPNIAPSLTPIPARSTINR